MVNTVCEKHMCNGCMVCVDSCPVNAITIVDTMLSYNAVIQTDRCLQCGICKGVCPNMNNMDKHFPELWYQGWAKDKGQRNEASSGGVASAIAEAFVEHGGIVCSCKFSNGDFVFGIAEDKESLKQFVGSKYVKSNPKGIYKDIQRMLTNGKKVLFIGLPCQVEAVKQAIPIELQNSLYIADIICHGTPSPKILELFLKQYQYSLQEISDISFRQKERECQGGKRIRRNGVVDPYMIAYLNSLCFTENCYHCQYADVKRISDVTLGDSWGNKLSNVEKQKGISLILCQSEKGKMLIENAKIHLEMVDSENAILNNRQLRNCSKKPRKRELFFELLAKKQNFNHVVRRCLLKEWVIQEVKNFLIKVKIYKKRCDVDYGITVQGGDMK